MIPKIIHYCWFGPHEKSNVALQCIESWKQFCPDFEIKEWTEATAKPYQNKFYKDALRKKKYAFVSDCVRAQALQEFGGIYLDTDMLLLKPISEEILSLDFFTGYEVQDRAAYGFFGAKKQHRLIKKMVKFYDTSEFNEFSLPVITHTFKKVINNDTIGSNEQIFDPHVFYALSYENRLEDYKKHTTTDSYAVHLWDHSWKHEKSHSRSELVKNLFVVLKDYVFYGYSTAYLKRYFKEFARKLIQKN